uniref:Lipase, hormone-sensitive a n=1 Tax=Fundulus heteroclitus TaxID=8078 RepID=A0A3Q2PKV8_FUNHE
RSLRRGSARTDRNRHEGRRRRCGSVSLPHGFKTPQSVTSGRLLASLLLIFCVPLCVVQVLQSCLLHIVHKGRYIASNYRGAFFRAEHNASEMEAYCSALCQLRALLHLAQRLIHDNDHGQLYTPQDADLSARFVQEYSSMHKACFYGRCLGFQFSPALRPFLQTIVISMVSYGETYGKQQSGIGTAALSLLTSGKYVIDPELRGAEFERITQNLDLHFWKSFWNVTESNILSGFTRIASNPVQVNLTLTVPPASLRLPLASDPSLSTTVSPPIAHWGPGPVSMRLISYELRDGQFTPVLTDPPGSAGLIVVVFCFVPQNYLRNWSKELSVPILSVDYSLSPEAPFPRALEECFYAYCWALNHCHLLGSTAERVCLAGDSAGGNLCITVSMRALTAGIRVPDGIMAAYPATLLTTDASPSRLLTLIDPLLPLGVLAKCLNAYAGSDFQTAQPAERRGSLSALSRDTALLLSDLTQGASNWIQDIMGRIRSEQIHGLECLDLLPKASALDALLDDSVMFAKKLRAMEQPVTLTVVDDLPHGFLSLAQICKETQFASDICVARIRDVFRPDGAGGGRSAPAEP